MDSNETMFVTGSADGDIKVHTKSKNFVTVEYRQSSPYSNSKLGVGFDLSESNPVLPSRTFEARTLQKHKSRSSAGKTISTDHNSIKYPLLN